MTARCRRPAAATVPGSAGATAPSRPSTATGRRRCSPTSASAVDERQGCGLPRRAAAARAGRAARSGLRRRQEGAERRLPEAARRRCRWPSGTWTTAGSRVRSKGLQERTEGGSGRSEICVEAMSADTRQRLASTISPTRGASRPSSSPRGAAQMAVLQFPTAETAKLHALIAPFVHPSMEYKLLPRYQGRFAVEPVFAEPRQVLMPMPITHDRGEAADAQHASLRPRGRGHATTTSSTA